MADLETMRRALIDMQLALLAAETLDDNADKTAASYQANGSQASRTDEMHEQVLARAGQHHRESVRARIAAAFRRIEEQESD